MEQSHKGGNLYNKYESNNPIVKLLMKIYFNDFDLLIYPIKNEIKESLEIGCGEGYLTKHLKDMGILVEGADLSEDVIEHAKKIHPNIKFTVLSIYDLTKSDNKYDIIFASEVFEHLEKTTDAIRELKEVSNKYIFFSVPNEPLFRLANVARLKYLSDFGNTPGHINHWSKNNFELYLNENGLEIIKIKTSTLWIMALVKLKNS